MSQSLITPSTASNYKVECISSVDRFQALESEWNRLASNFASPLLRHEWFAAAIRAFPHRSELAVFVAKAPDGSIHAIAPLVFKREGKFSCLRVLGHEVPEPAGFLYDDDKALKIVIDALIRRGLPFEMRGFRTASKETTELSRARTPRALRFVLPNVASSTWARLEKSGDALEAKMSASRLRELRRQHKQASQIGPFAFEAIAPTEANLAANLERLFEVEASGWKARERTAIAADGQMREFYTSYARLTARLGILRFFFLTIGGETAAAIMGVQYAKRIWSLKIGYRESLAKCSPGLMLQHNTIRTACDLGLEGYEFLGGSEPWQERWPHAKHGYSTILSYPLSPSGLYFFFRASGSALGRRVGSLLTTRSARKAQRL